MIFNYLFKSSYIRYSLLFQVFPVFCVSGDTHIFLKSACVFALKGSKEVVKHLFPFKPQV